ncbi:MAG: hypothetical protein ACI9EF_003591 [Pseudohongiellaceae bacterium]|jgi:hypothetical protein
MTGRIIDAVTANLQRAAVMVNSIDADTYKNAALPPYYSGIGAHLRHILDIFACVIRGHGAGTIDFTDRRRDTPAEQDPALGLAYLDRVISDLNALRPLDAGTSLTMLDDLGEGELRIPITLGAALVTAHSNAIHHYACIGFLLSQQGITLPDERFGLNPTTPLATPS